MKSIEGVPVVLILLALICIVTASPVDHSVDERSTRIRNERELETLSDEEVSKDKDVEDIGSMPPDPEAEDISQIAKYIVKINATHEEVKSPVRRQTPTTSNIYTVGNNAPNPYANWIAVGRDYIESFGKQTVSTQGIEELDSISCQEESVKYGHSQETGVMTHELLCEVRKLYQYVVISRVNLQKRLVSKSTYYPFVNLTSSAHPATGNASSQGSLSNFFTNPANMAALSEIVQECVPLSSIQVTLLRMNSATQRFLTHLRDEVTKSMKQDEHEKHEHDEIMSQMRDKAQFLESTIMKLFRDHAGLDLGKASNTSKAPMMDTVFNKLDEMKLLVSYYTKVVQELTQLGTAIYQGYHASGLPSLIAAHASTCANTSTTSSAPAKPANHHADHHNHSKLELPQISPAALVQFLQQMHQFLRPFLGHHNPHHHTKPSIGHGNSVSKPPSSSSPSTSSTTSGITPVSPQSPNRPQVIYPPIYGATNSQSSSVSYTPGAVPSSSSGATARPTGTSSASNSGSYTPQSASSSGTVTGVGSSFVHPINRFPPSPGPVQGQDPPITQATTAPLSYKISLPSLFPPSETYSFSSSSSYTPNSYSSSSTLTDAAPTGTISQSTSQSYNPQSASSSGTATGAVNSVGRQPDGPNPHSSHGQRPVLSLLSGSNVPPSYGNPVYYPSSNTYSFSSSSSYTPQSASSSTTVTGAQPSGTASKSSSSSFTPSSVSTSSTVTGSSSSPVNQEPVKTSLPQNPSVPLLPPQLQLPSISSSNSGPGPSFLNPIAAGNDPTKISIVPYLLPINSKGSSSQYTSESVVPVNGNVNSGLDILDTSASSSPHIPIRVSTNPHHGKSTHHVLSFPHAKVAAVLGKKNLNPGDTITIFVKNGAVLIGHVVDVVNPILFNRFDGKGPISSLRKGGKLWKIRARDFQDPDCRRKLDSFAASC